MQHIIYVDFHIGKRNSTYLDRCWNIMYSCAVHIVCMCVAVVDVEVDVVSGLVAAVRMVSVIAKNLKDRRQHKGIVGNHILYMCTYVRVEFLPALRFKHIVLVTTCFF